MKTIITKLLMLTAVLLASTNIYAYDFEVDGIYYNIISSSEKTVEVTYLDYGYVSYSGDIVIPEQVSYKNATYSVTSIHLSAFQGCTGLTSVTIPNSVTTIENNAFASCSELKSVNISNLSAWCKIDFNVGQSNPLNNGANLFLNGELITDLTIPNDITEIKHYTFYGCSGLTSVTIPNSVTSIGRFAFGDCSGLTSVTIPNSVTSIGNSAFSYCSGLTSVTIPNSVTSIGGYAFSYCSGLTSVTIPNRVTSIEESTFSRCSGLTSVTIPNSVTTIGDAAFYGCSGLTSVTIPNSVTTIERAVFDSCDKLRYLFLFPPTPPTVVKTGTSGTRYFQDEQYENITLYVPEENINTYAATEPWYYFKNITYQIVEKVNISIDKRTVELSCETEGAEIHYTLDGSTPDQNSIKYSGPFKVNENCTVKAIAIKKPWVDSGIAVGNVTDVVNVKFKQEENTSVYNGSSQIPEIEANGDIDLSEIDIKAYRLANDDSWKSVPTENVKNTGRYKLELSVDNETAYGKSTAYLTITKAEPNFVWNQTFETMGVGEKVYLDFSCDNTEFLPVFSNYNEKVIEIGTDIDGGTFKWYVKGVGKGVTNLSMSYAECDNYFASETINKIIMVDGNAEIKTTATPTITINKRNVEISCETEDAEIYYTLDGTIPNANSTKYSGAFKVNENCTVKAIATKESWQDSEIAVENVTDVVNVNFKQEENTSVYNGSSQMPEIETNGDIDLSEIDIKAYTANGDYWINMPIESVKNAGRYKFELNVDNETTYGKSTAYLTITKAEPNLVWNQTFDIVEVGKKIYLDFSCDNTEYMPVFSNYDDKVIGIGSEIDGNGFKWYVEAIGKGVTNLTMSYAECENYFASETITKTITVVDNAGISDMSKDNIRAYGNDGVIHIVNCETNALVNIYTASGTLVYSGTDKEVALEAQGIYIVRVSGQTFKVIL